MRDDLTAYGVFSYGGIETYTMIPCAGCHDHGIVKAIHFARFDDPCPVATISKARKAFQERHGLTLKTINEIVPKPGTTTNRRKRLAKVEVNELALENPRLKVKWSYYQIPNSSLYDVAMDIYSTEHSDPTILHPREWLKQLDYWREQAKKPKPPYPNY